MAYGLYKLFIGTRERNELAREKIWSRIHLIPLLQAEEDRDQARRYFADKAREKELLGTDTKIYNSDRYVMDPHHIYLAKLLTGFNSQIRETNLHVYPISFEIGLSV
ncbi:uncharacterized protein ARB_04687 [Trichophyton benhamiae CBS 112371]|uniref:NADH dehydrogenase [ubiquinone] 1 alpha subcomplex subunit 13 n=1 Tax=Arthroderma benhamiae (strain ATCC MYA-4681 / CBS 112371) TaxID=663331 RepID=D4AK85_ARTBC|nr:uncharacterized protein ARB_04687 [Trichophyton benhamiae CBS 112371]EFE37158.1 hypothetical protein ARB_04687 [Trichophyton benhamiae CBS 112371]